MFCMKCGTKLPDDAKFCYNCGKKIEINKVSAAPEIEKEEKAETPELNTETLKEPEAKKPAAEDRMFMPVPENKATEKTKKEKANIDIKRFVPLIGVGVIAVIFMILLFSGCNMLFGKKNLPDPEYYFKNVGTIEFDGNGIFDSHVYTVKTDEDITDIALEYCDLLKDEYSFREWYEGYSDIDDYGDFEKTFEYDGIRLGHDTSWDIKIEFDGPYTFSSDNNCTLVISVYNPEKFNLVKNEQHSKLGNGENEDVNSTDAESDKLKEIGIFLLLPGPKDYFDEIAEVNITEDEGKQVFTVISEIDLKAATDAYSSLLAKSKSLKIKGSTRLGNYGYTYTYVYTGEGAPFDNDEPVIQIRYENNSDESLNGKYKTVVTYCYPDNIMPTPGVSYQEEDIKPSPTPEQTIDVSALPDLLKNDPTGEFEISQLDSSSTKAFYVSDNVDNFYVGENYIKLIEAMGYEKISENLEIQDNYLDGKTYTCQLSHKDVDGVVKIIVSSSGYFESCNIIVDFSYDMTVDGFVYSYEDPDEPDPDDPDDFWDDDDDDRHTTPCGYCNNGDCKKCDGDGYVWSYISGKDDKNCTGAYCQRGKCLKCGGDGTVGD